MQSEIYPIKGKKVLVVGLGLTGAALTRYLTSHGADVTVTDERNKTDLKTHFDPIENLPKVNFQLGRHVLKTFQEQDLVIVSPGVSLDIKPVQAAIKEGIPVIGEIEFASSLISKPIIAVTGTNGKTTTTTMIRDMLNASGVSCWMGGNIGTPLIDYLNQKANADVIVLEVSSFQLETTQTFHPHTVVFLNVAPNHFDRHGNFENYLSTKARILKNLVPEDRVVYNGKNAAINDALGGFLNPAVPTYGLTYGREETDRAAASATFKGALLKKGELCLRLEDTWEKYNTQNVKVLGVHNKENFALAAMAARLNGAKPAGVQSVIDEFKGLEHRLEFVTRKNAVNFYNDSKSTNCDSLIKALSVFSDSVILIAGGQNKGLEFEPLIPHIKTKIKNLILYGEAKEAMNRAIGDETETFLMGTFEEAVLLAYQKSRGGDTVLLSPGCSSHDMFESYEERGNYFKQLVNQF